MNLTEWGLLIALSVLWGGSFFFNSITVRELPPLVIVTCRVGLAAIILHLILAALGQRLPLTGASVRAFFGMGLLNNVIPFTLIVFGQRHIGSGLAAILNATTPLFSVIVAHVLTTDEKMSGRRLVGVLAGILGVVAMIGPSMIVRPTVGGAVPDAGYPESNIIAQLAVLAAAVSYGFANVFGRRFRALGVPPLGTAAGQVTASTVMLLPLTLLFDQPWHLPPPSLIAVAALVASAALSTALAYVIFFRILSTAGATNLSLVTLLVPVSALILGAAILGEPIDLSQMLGMALIGLGLAAIDGRLIDWAIYTFSARGGEPFT